MPELTTYDFNEAPVRALLDEQGEPWFVAADVCRALDLSNPSMACGELEEDERMTLSNTDGHSGKRGGAQSFNLISESGLYTLIFKSRKPEAKDFRRWVTKEVLPTIRKTGRYEVAGLEQGEEAEINEVLATLKAAVLGKAAGKISNADATVLATIASQYLRGWDVKLRLRAGRPQ